MVEEPCANKEKQTDSRYLRGVGITVTRWRVRFEAASGGQESYDIPAGKVQSPPHMITLMGVHFTAK
jgi:hypothetical protein